MKNIKTLFKKTLKHILNLASIFIVIIVLMFFEILIFARTGLKGFFLATILLSLIIAFLLKYFAKRNSRKTEVGVNRDFVSMVAHELKASLSGIKWSLKMLTDNDFGQITQEQRDVILRIFKKNDAMIYLLDDLLNLTKIEKGSYTYEKEPAEIESILLSVISDYKDEIKRKNINFEFKKPTVALPEIMVDKHKIELAIQNVFDNAIKYTKDNGAVKIFLSSNVKEIEIKIQDSGIGINKNQHQKVFTKFFRADNAKKIESDGTGLGLFISEKIITAHKGKIWFVSEENSGSVFYITLPYKN